MNRLKKLVSEIRRDNKIPTDEIIALMIDVISDCEDENCYKDVYMDLYVKAYGRVVTKELAEEWVKSLEVTDGTDRETGQKWTIEQTSDVGNKIGIDWTVMPKVEWYIAMNMEYSTHYATAKAYGNESDALWFAHIAKDEWYNKEGSESMLECYIKHL